MLARTDETEDDFLQSPAHRMAMLVQTITAAAQELEDAVKLHNKDGSINLSRQENLEPISVRHIVDALSHAGNQVLFAASSADIVCSANEEIASENRKLVRIV